ncbi:MAG: hypothetical protein PSX80_04790 [bacterium]|nr:hypothetical protein [bacterium]
MIPFALPRNREFVNLAQIVRAIVGAPGTKDEGTVIVQFSNGITEIYTGEAGEFIAAEVNFLLQSYRQFQRQMQSGLVGPDGQPPSLIM